MTAGQRRPEDGPTVTHHSRHHDHADHQGPRSPWWAARNGHDSALRVSNAEREAVVTTLIAHWSDGRLDEATFDQRAARARAAVTRGDLDGLLQDLPPLHPEAPVAPRRGRPHRSGALLALVMVILALATLPHALWLIGFPAVPWLLISLIVVVLLRGRHHRHS